MKKIHFHLIFLLFWGLFSQMAFSQEDPSQYFVFEKGQQFRLLKQNMVCTNWNQVEMDQKMKLGKEPSFKFLDNSENEQTSLYLHFPLLIQPYTAYVLRYSTRLKDIRKPLPYLQIDFLDYNRDYLDTLKRVINNTDTASQWVQEEIKFTTSGQTYGLILYVYTEKKGTANFWLENIVLEQISEPLAFKPAGIPILGKQTITFSKNEKITKKDLGLIPISKNMKNFTVSLDLDWNNYKGITVLTIDWLTTSQQTTPSCQDYCEIEPFSGIESSWDGVSLSWKRKYHDSAVTTSYQLDRFLNQPLQRRFSTHQIIIPSGFGFMRIHIQKDPGFSGTLILKDFMVTAEE